jgi:hypothetical protein
MRFGLRAAIAALVAALAAGCADDGATAGTADCPRADRPALVLATRPAAPPPTTARRCLGARFAWVFGTRAWGTAGMPDPGAADDRAWQSRLLLAAAPECGGCAETGLPLERVREEHPEWILRTAAGDELHPLGAPRQVLLDFGDPAYQAAWAERVNADLERGGFTGVEVLDAGNRPRWSDRPIDPRTGRPLTEDARRRYLAEALALVRASAHLAGFQLLADNGPAGTIVRTHIAGADVVSVGTGFARARGARWQALFRYFRAAARLEVGALPWDGESSLSPAERAWGIAGYLLVATERSAYGVDRGAISALFDLRPAFDLPAERRGAAWVRALGPVAVAVNPSSAPATVRLPGAGPASLAPWTAVITANGRVVARGAPRAR